MLFNQRKSRIACGLSLGAVTLGAAAAIAAQTHPAAAAGILAAVNSAITCATTAACVSGTNTANGPGVKGTSNAGYGVFGLSNGTGTGVFGGAHSGWGMYGYSNQNDGVEGVSTNLNGVEGLSYATNGTAVGVKGSTNSGSGDGVWGTVSGGGTGVEGDSGKGIGVYGGGGSEGVIGASSGGHGVEAQTDYGTALSGFASEGLGLYVNNGSGDGGVISSGGVGAGLDVFNNSPDYPAVYGINSGGGYGYGGHFSGNYGGVWGEAPAGGFPIVATNAAQPHPQTVFYVDGNGNIAYTGSLKPFALTADGATVQAYSPKTTLPTVEDTGTAQLAGGTAAVRLDPTFAKSIEPGASYRVFVTANGDTNGLFVASKSAGGFVVHENRGGRSTVSFDYRIVATALGQTGQRMAVRDRAAVMPRLLEKRVLRTLLKPAALPAMRLRR
jgi:hypothetical protein